MAQEAGFLDSLGIGSRDEKDIVTAQRDKLRNDIERAREAQGRTGGRAIAGLLGGAGNILKNRSFRGTGQAVAQAHANVTDRDVAQATGISVDQLKGRREMRKLSQEVNSGSFADRIALARKIADIANRSGDSEVLGSALKRISDLKTEKTEFDKLKAETSSAESKAREDSTVDAWLDGEDVTGTMARDENGRRGLNIADENGVIQFEPWGERLTRTDPDANIGVQKSDSEIVRQHLGAARFNEVRESVLANRTTVRKYDSILSMMLEASEDDNISAVVGRAGPVISVLDNFVRGLRGVLKSFVPNSVFDKDSEILGRWRNKAKNPNDSIWDQVQLPAYVQEDSAQAQNYRSQIIELAYLAARAAEPGNGRLSDTDIENALKKLGAESGNPQVMFRRSMEIVISGSREVDDRLEGHYQSFDRRNGTKVPNADVDRILGGTGLKEYRKDTEKLYKKFNVSVTEDGRAVFNDPIGADVQPKDDLRIDNRADLPVQGQQLPIIEDEQANTILDLILAPSLEE